jgi:hypothetical protein
MEGVQSDDREGCQNITSTDTCGGEGVVGKGVRPQSKLAGIRGRSRCAAADGIRTSSGDEGLSLMTRRSAPTLYKAESEIAERVLGAGANKWPAIATVLEREGLPRIDPMFGMRFWPAVQSFFLRRHGIIDAAVPAKTDGLETW